MGATNTTTHYNLSQFVSTDKPTWLQDYNGDMAKIDAGIDAAKVAADTAQATANSASGAATQNANDIAALSTDVTGQGANITALQLAVNTINSLIGNGTPTTTDQTIIGAINEINANVGVIGTTLSGMSKIKSAEITVNAASGIAATTLPTTTKLVSARSNTNGRFVSGFFPTSGNTWDFYVASTSGAGAEGTISITYYYEES